MITRRWYDDPSIILPAAVLLGGAIIAVPMITMMWTTGRSPSNSWEAKVKLCDQAVETLLHSPELVEVTRAGIIIREVSCSIGKRLP